MPRAGMAFGLRPTEFPITEWPQLVKKCLGTIAMIPKQFVFAKAEFW
jgi:hypothetical protein